MKAAISMVVLLSLGISPGPGAAQSLAETAPASIVASAASAAITARPFLEVEARGIRTTNLNLPFCHFLCSDLHPHFVSYRVAITNDGAVAGTLTENDLEAPSSPAVTRLFLGTATPEEMARLRALSGEARIGFEQGGCTTGFTEDIEPYPAQHIYRLSYSVLWFGKGNRRNSFELPAGTEACAAPLRDLMDHILSVARDAQRIASE